MGRHYRQNAARVAAVVAAILPALAFLLGGAGRPAYAQAGPFPSAIVKVWDTAAPVGGIPLGATPGESSLGWASDRPASGLSRALIQWIT
jgi:hypothetical protein